ncbi:MAG: hypothetical protein U0L23_01925 [Lachnospiraceae bacterium]|nr:hypothetical protein [Lachnospiraceae bacterium]MEE1341451.1 hypothetical protein [Lachnospiraceae bacterium]
MVTLTFVFNQDKLKNSGYTEDELLHPMREHAKKYDISEKQSGVFSKEGKDALCVVSMFIPQITKQYTWYVNLMDKWTLDVDGEVEDCIQTTHRWVNESNN